jgi:hypothetical protein
MHLTNNSRFGVWPSGTPPVEHPMPPKEVRFRERERSDLKTIWLGSIALLRQLELDWTAIGERSVQKGRLSHACLHE